MNAITLELPDALAKVLVQEAKTKGVSPEALAQTWLQDRAAEAAYQSANPLSQPEIKGIGRGLADVVEGRVVSHDNILADLARWRSE